MKLSLLELRHLHCFVTVAEELNFRQAAKRLNVTPGALSPIIQKLESVLEMKLFERTTTNVRLTKPGREFLREAQAVLKRVEKALATARKIAGKNLQSLHIAVCGNWRATFVPKALDTYRKRFPKVEVSLIDIGMLDDSSKAFDDEPVDIRFSYNLKNVHGKDIGYFKTFDLPLEVTMSARHPLAARTQVELEELVAYPLVLWTPLKRLNQDLLNFFHSQKLRPRVKKAATFEIAMDMLTAENCVAFLPKIPTPFFHDSQIVLRPLKSLTPVPHMKGYALWKKDKLTPQALHFIEILQQLCEQQKQSDPAL